MPVLFVASSGEIVKKYPRNTLEMLHVDPKCYERDGLQEAVPPPLPLGRMARRLEEIAATGVATRSIDFYAALVTSQTSERQASSRSDVSVSADGPTNSLLSCSR